MLIPINGITIIGNAEVNSITPITAESIQPVFFMIFYLENIIDIKVH